MPGGIYGSHPLCCIRKIRQCIWRENYLDIPPVSWESLYLFWPRQKNEIPLEDRTIALSSRGHSPIKTNVHLFSFLHRQARSRSPKDLERVLTCPLTQNERREVANDQPAGQSAGGRRSPGAQLTHLSIEGKGSWHRIATVPGTVKAKIGSTSRGNRAIVGKIGR